MNLPRSRPLPKGYLRDKMARKSYVTCFRVRCAMYVLVGAGFAQMSDEAVLVRTALYFGWMITVDCLTLLFIRQLMRLIN